MIAKTLKFSQRYIDAAGGDWPEIYDATQEVANNATSIFDKITAPSIVRAMLTYGKALAIHRSTQIAVEIERYRVAHGALPESFAQLPDAAAAAQDPFTGKSLLYVKVADGYCVYSAGYKPPADRDKDPIAWADKWGIHVRTATTPK